MSAWAAAAGESLDLIHARAAGRRKTAGSHGSYACRLTRPSRSGSCIVTMAISAHEFEQRRRNSHSMATQPPHNCHSTATQLPHVICVIVFEGAFRSKECLCFYINMHLASGPHLEEMTTVASGSCVAVEWWLSGG